MQFEHRPEKKQFVLKINEEDQAVVNYIEMKDVFYLNYSEVPLNQRQKGYGKELISRTLEYLKANEIKYVPICGFIKAYISYKNRMQSK